MTPSPFALQSVPGFPYSDWVAQQERYLEFERWYSGAALDDKIQDKNGNLIDKFPLHLNPIPNTCEKHTAVLLGNTLESIRDGGVPVTFVPEGEDKEGGQVVSDALTNAFLAGGGGQLFVSNGILSQYLGGCVWGVSWQPTNKELPVQVVTPLPTEFLAYPKGNNYWELREAWFVREISWMDALAYGYPVPEIIRQAQTPTDVKNSGFVFYYIEHWKEDTYSIQVNEMKIRLDGVLLEGTNPWGVVPFVYIPHLRIKNFLGESMINNAIKGIIREMNLRNADIGDAVSDDSHSVLAIRGVRTTLKPQKLPDGRVVVDLGSSPGLGSNEIPPDLFAVRTQSAAEPQLKFTDKLESMYRVEARHPAVADGVDEGSQRSSLTLTTRMWPMQSHVELERINWTTGLLRLAKMILLFSSLKGAYKVTPAHMGIKLILKWAPMLPRDRTELVNEIAMRKKNELISRQHGISLFGDVDNVEAEIKNIDADLEASSRRAIAQKTAAAATAEKGENPSKESPDANQSSPNKE